MNEFLANQPDSQRHPFTSDDDSKPSKLYVSGMSLTQRRWNGEYMRMGNVYVCMNRSYCGWKSAPVQTKKSGDVWCLCREDGIRIIRKCEGKSLVGSWGKGMHVTLQDDSTPWSNLDVAMLSTVALTSGVGFAVLAHRVGIP